MIKLVRLDERLIHGQVAIKWSRHTGVDRIIVANDDAANNPIIKKSLMMAAPQTVKVAIKSVEDSIKLLLDPRAESLKILLIISNPYDLIKILENVQGINKINIGNFGRVAPKHGEEVRERLADNIYVYPEEKDAFKAILNFGIDTEYQVTPESSPVKLNTLLDR